MLDATRPPHRLRAALFAMTTLALACENDKGANTIDVPGNVTNVADPAVASLCAGKRDGTACGSGRHCVSGDCVYSVCGDHMVDGDEQCDDGNLALGDGCSPTCTWELVACPGNGWVKLGESCAGDSDSDAGSVIGTEPLDCPRSTALSWAKKLPQEIINVDFDPSYPYIVVGEAPELSARAGKLTRVMWVSRPDPDDSNVIQAQDLRPGITDRNVWSQERFVEGGLTTHFTCDPDLSHYVNKAYTFELGYFLISTNGLLCPYQLANFQKVQCRIPGFSQAWDFDASVLPPDAGARDASVEAGVNDGGGSDAGTSDAGLSDAGVLTDGGARFRSPACEACMQEKCAVFADLDFINPCLKGTGLDIDGQPFVATFASECAPAFFCAHLSPDHCADNTTLGSVGCFCGVGVDLTECAISPSNAKGRCQAEYYRATHCTTPACVLDRFDKWTDKVPAGYAKGLLECQVTDCAPECVL